MTLPQGWWKSAVLLFSLSSPCAQALAPGDPAPRLPSRSVLLENLAYSASFNAAYKQADWVFYALGANELRGCVKRANSFRPDPRIPAGQGPELSDYKGSGFDRGHLTPSGDNRWSAQAQSESFLLTNMSPQPSRFNSGIWARLELLVRAWAKNMGGLWVATGPVLRDGLPTIGAGRVAVPEHYYKVLASFEEGRARAVAFLLPTDASGDFSRYSMTVDQLEAVTGLDFLVGLQGEEEAEGAVDLARWDTRAKFSYLPCQAVSPTKEQWAWGLSVE
jgi:endonuclease G, mitochondrial